jgi:hypothetical protein
MGEELGRAIWGKSWIKILCFSLVPLVATFWSAHLIRILDCHHFPGAQAEVLLLQQLTLLTGLGPQPLLQNPQGPYSGTSSV